MWHSNVFKTPQSIALHSQTEAKAGISVGIDPNQTRPSIRFVSGQVKSMFLTNGSVEWDFGRAGRYRLLVLAVGSRTRDATIKDVKY